MPAVHYLKAVDAIVKVVTGWHLQDQFFPRLDLRKKAKVGIAMSANDAQTLTGLRRALLMPGPKGKRVTLNAFQDIEINSARRYLQARHWPGIRPRPGFMDLIRLCQSMVPGLGD